MNQERVGPGWEEGEAHKTLGTTACNLLDSDCTRHFWGQKGQDLNPQIRGFCLIVTGSLGNGSLPERSYKVLGRRCRSGPSEPGAGRQAEMHPPRASPLGWEAGGASIVTCPSSETKLRLPPPRVWVPPPEARPRPPGRWASAGAPPTSPSSGLRGPAGAPGPWPALTGRGLAQAQAHIQVLHLREGGRGGGASARAPGSSGAAVGLQTQRAQGHRLGGLQQHVPRHRLAARVAALALVLEHQTQALHAALGAHGRSGPRLAAHPAGRRGRAKEVGSGPEPGSRAERRRCHGRPPHADSRRRCCAVLRGAQARGGACRFNKPSWDWKGAGTAHPRRAPIGRLWAPPRADWL